jgi:hypothetical protein
MNEDGTPDWADPILDHRDSIVFITRMQLRKDQLLAASGGACGPRARTVLNLWGYPESDDYPMTRAVLIFTPDDTYKDRPPAYDSDQKRVIAYYPMSALAAVTYILERGQPATCTYIKYQNGMARVDVRKG